MKIATLATILLLPASGSAEVRPAATKESLLAKRAELATQQKGKLIQQVSSEVLVQERTKGTSILESSHYLLGERGWTLVPKGSVPSVGKSFTLTTTKPVSLKFMEWAEFVRFHRSGLQTIPISQNMLGPEADTKLIKERITSLQKLGVTCVTTYKQQPVRISQSNTSSKS